MRGSPLYTGPRYSLPSLSPLSLPSLLSPLSTVPPLGGYHLSTDERIWDSANSATYAPYHLLRHHLCFSPISFLSSPSFPSLSPVSSPLFSLLTNTLQGKFLSDDGRLEAYLFSGLAGVGFVLTCMWLMIDATTMKSICNRPPLK